MAAFVLITVATVIGVELFKKLPFPFHIKKLKLVIERVFTVLKSSSISDHWKQQSLLNYSGQLFKVTVNLFFLLITGLAPFLFLLLLSSMTNFEVEAYLLSTYGILFITLFALTYAFLRDRLV